MVLQSYTVNRSSAELADVSLVAARDLIAKLDAEIPEIELGSPFSADPKIVSSPLSKEKFVPITDSSVARKRKVAFVDGGNLEIIGAPNFSIQLNRTYSSCWSGTERRSLALPRVEFFSAIFSTFRTDDIYYESILVPCKNEFTTFLPNPLDISFGSNDRTVVEGGARADIQLVGSIARNFAEWRMAEIAAEALGEGDILVMDGSLQTQFKKEGTYFGRVKEIALKKGIIFCGLSKTSSLFTTTGLSLLGAVSKLARESGIKSEWYYPIFESIKPGANIATFVTKLKSISEWVFRFDIDGDIYKDLGDGELNEIFSALVTNASDVTFPGYPYGLIDADFFSRVSEDEKEYYGAIMYSQIAGLKKREKFLDHIRAKDAHGMLNMVVGK